MTERLSTRNWVLLQTLRSHQYEDWKQGSKPVPGWHACTCGWEGYWCDWHPHVAEALGAALDANKKEIAAFVEGAQRKEGT